MPRDGVTWVTPAGFESPPSAPTEPKSLLVQSLSDLAGCRLQHVSKMRGGLTVVQRQRISIARALIDNSQLSRGRRKRRRPGRLDSSRHPEPNLLRDLTTEHGLTFLFISHDLSLVAHVCDVVAVMYLGRLVEMAPTRKLFSRRRHPYTAALLSAIPSLDSDHPQNTIPLIGEIPSALVPRPGCRFHTRCAFARERCRSETPRWRAVDDDHFVACHFADELNP